MRFSPLVLAWLVGLAAISAPAQIWGPELVRPALEKALEIGMEGILVRAFQHMREAVPDPARDAERYKTDSAYRREYQAAVKKAGEQRKQLALRFLDRFGPLLDKGTGLFYKGLALKFADDCPRAVAALARFRRTVRRHRWRSRALVELADCMLEEDPALGSADDRERERRRLRRAGAYLRMLGREKLEAREEASKKALEARLQASELRLAYYKLIDRLDDLKRSVVRAEIARVLNDENTDENVKSFLRKARANEVLLDSLIQDPDELTYHLSNAVRREYWNLRARTEWRVQNVIRTFYQEHRKALDAETGLLWKARARKLARDARRAAAGFRRFRAAFPGHPEAVEVALEETRLYLHALDRPEAAREVLEALSREALTPEQAETVKALRSRVEKELDARNALDRRIGRAPEAIPVVASIGPRPDLSPAGLKGGITVLVYFAAWSKPSRETLAKAAELVQAEPTVRVVGITRFFGFGWEASSPGAATPGKKTDEGGDAQREAGALEGRPAGPDLPRDRERELCAGLWKAAGLEGPLVFTRPEVLDALPALPAVVVVDAEGRVRYSGVGGRQGFKQVPVVVKRLLER
jgi:hypothetical protein